MRRQLGFRYTPGQERPGRALAQVSAAWGRAEREALEELGLTPGQYALLEGASVLQAAGERVTQRRLAGHANIDAMSTSQAVRLLEEKGLLVRSPDPEDSRAILVALTRTGKRLLVRAMRRTEAAEAAFFAPLGSDAQKLVELLQQLTPDEAE